MAAAGAWPDPAGRNPELGAEPVDAGRAMAMGSVKGVTSARAVVWIGLPGMRLIWVAWLGALFVGRGAEAGLSRERGAFGKVDGERASQQTNLNENRAVHGIEAIGTAGEVDEGVGAACAGTAAPVSKLG